MSDFNQSSLNDNILFIDPVLVRYNRDNNEVHRLVESDGVYNESLIVSSCRYYKEESDPVIIISDTDKELANEIGQSVVYQFKDSQDPNRSVDPLIDYYSYLENNKIIPLNLPNDITSVELLDNSDPLRANVLLTCDIPSDPNSMLSDCQKLLIISENNSDNFNVITEVHKMSGTPHLKYHDDIMDNGKMTKIVRTKLYNNDNNILIDNRSNNILGQSTGNNLWEDEE